MKFICPKCGCKGVLNTSMNPVVHSVGSIFNRKYFVKCTCLGCRDQFSSLTRFIVYLTFEQVETLEKELEEAKQIPVGTVEE
jgi:hypothetical protein